MPAFDASFDPLAFDVGGGAAVLVGTGVASAGLAVAVVSPLVFDSSAGYVRWSALVAIGGVDLSDRLCGSLRITAGEDSARVASFSLVPRSVLEMEAWEGAEATIDVTLFRSLQTATYRLFTGPVESVVFDPNERVAAVDCRDGWQERPKACATAAEVQALLSGGGYPSQHALPWSDSTPDPSGYFSGLLETLQGATAIDANGLWRVIPWAIGTPAASFAAREVFDGSVSVTGASRSALPESVNATVALRYSRLHAVDIALQWQAVNYERYVIDGLPACPKSTVVAAIEGVSDWLVKGHINLVEPTPGAFPVYMGVEPSYYVLSPEVARTLCNSFTVTMYRRWYQQIEAAYSVDIPVGGSSGRSDTVQAGITSSFDAGEWEKAPSADHSASLYSRNPPTPPEPPTGYEGLPEPHPANGAIDHLPDISSGDLNELTRHVVARAVRKAAQGRRQRTVRFSRPLDPRWEIGAVLAMAACGVTATGQVAELEHELDFDAGSAVSSFRLAVPEGNGTATAFTASAALPSNSVSHILNPKTLGNWIGSSWETPANPDEDALVGFLCNIDPRSENYNSATPGYEPQFRIILPEIRADWRDPVTSPLPISVTFTIAAGSLEFVF